MTDVGLTHIALQANDLEASIAFYAAYAAMEVVHRREGVAWLGDGTRPFVIVLIAAPQVESALGPDSHLGVACASREEVDRLAALARKEGRLINGPEDYGPPVGYWIFVRDPDGHTLELSYGQDLESTIDG